MDAQFEIMTGLLTYRDIEFTFVFDKNELRLIPPKDKDRAIELEWLMTSIGKGVYTVGNPLQMEKPVLFGRCNETGRKIIFLPQEGAHIGSRNSVLFIEIVAYIECIIDRDMIDRISFSSPELNFIHPVNEAFTITLNTDTYSDKGVIELSTMDFASTTTNRQEFYVDNKKTYVNFGVSRRISTKIDEAPISLNTSMMFEFEATDDYLFILSLYRIAKSFIQYMCYRKNIQLSKAELSAPHKNGKHENFATLYMIEEIIIDEPETLKKGRYIKQAHVSGAEGKILSDIASNLIYTRHIPKTYEVSRYIDAASFIMITSAFEWEFRRIYPNGVKKSKARAEAEESVQATLKDLIDKNTGVIKKIYKHINKLVRSDSLQNEITQVGTDLSDIIDIFGIHLYGINNQKLNISDVGKRLADQRNHYAHGDLDKDFIGLSLLDLIFLERIIYAMQMKYYGIKNREILKAINELFHCNIAL